MEWTVVTVIIALAGLGAVTIRPIVSLNTAITKLTVAVDQLQKDIEGLTSKNSKAHERMWEHNEGQDGWLDDHEKRISQIEACEM